MRKILCLIIAITTAVCAYSQGSYEDENNMQFSGGVKGEMNLSQYLIVPEIDLNSYCNIGASAGGFLRFEFLNNFSIQGELLMHYKCSNLHDDGLNHLKIWSLEVPIYAMYSLRFEEGDAMNFGLGPYCEFGLIAVMEEPNGYRNLYDINRREEIQAMRDSNSGFGVMIGYETDFGLQVNLSYKISITNILDSNSYKAAFYPMTASVGVAYRWKK